MTLFERLCNGGIHPVLALIIACLARDDKDGLTTLAQYILRNPFSISKMTYNSTTGVVVYKSKMGFGKNRQNFKIFSAREFIAAITLHIPDKRFQMLRYFGWYSNRKRGERKKEIELIKQSNEISSNFDDTIEVLDVSDYNPKNIPSPTWRECIIKIWEVDPLECPKCQGEMRIIGFITEAIVIRMILKHIGLCKERSPPLRNSDDLSHKTLVYEAFDDGWSKEYQEPYITLN